MEMKFAEYRQEKRVKKLERSLKLASLRKSEKVTNDGPITPATLYTSMPNINTDTQNANCTTLSMQTFPIENKVVSLSNNLRNIMPIEKSRYTMNEPIAATPSSIKQSWTQKDNFKSKTASSFLGDNDFHDRFQWNLKSRNLFKSDNGMLSSMETSSYSMPMNKNDFSHNACHFKLGNENTEKNNSSTNNYSSSQVALSRIKKNQDRTFFNWRVMLNEDGQLLLKGMLENGKVARSKPIVKRLTATSVQSIFQHIYYLEGNIVDNRSELPEYVRGKFYSGFPDDWENVHQVWALYVSQGSKTSFHWPTKITDSDDDINSEITDLTFVRTKVDGNRHYKSDMKTQISKTQISSISDIKVSSSGMDGGDWKRRTFEFKPVSNCEINMSDSENMLVSGMKNQVYDHKFWDKKNQCQHTNVHDHKLALLKKKNTMKDIIQEDKINIIVSNLLQKDCPKEYILKIVQMFDCLHDVFSYRIDTDKTNCENKVTSDDKELYNIQILDEDTGIDSKGSPILERCNTSPVKNYIVYNKCNGDVHKISSGILQVQSANYCNLQDKINDTPVHRQETKDVDEFRNEIYVGVPRVISEEISHYAKKNLLKREKCKQEKETINVNSTTLNDIRSKKKFKKKRAQTCHSSSSDDDIANDKKFVVQNKERKDGGERTMKALDSTSYCKEGIDNVHYDSSVSIIEDDDLQVKEKFNRVKIYDKRERDRLKYKQICDVSTTDDETDLINLKHKKHLDTTEVVKHSSKKPKIINNDEVDRTADNLHIIGENNNILTRSGIVKCDIVKNCCPLNMSKDINNSGSKFATLLSSRKERNGGTRKSSVVNCAKGDQNNEYENSSKFCRIPKRNESQFDLTTIHENAKSNLPEILTAHKDVSVNIHKAKTLFCQDPNNEIADNSTDHRKIIIQACNTDNKTFNYASDASTNELVNTEKFRLLCDWVPRVVKDSKSTCKLGLIFEGKLLHEAGHVVHRKFVTECVRKRLSSTLIETTNRELYQLVGDMYDPKNVVPKEILIYCRNGCPPDINEFCQIWKSVQRDKAKEIRLIEEDTTTGGIMNVSTSTRGRKRFPPLSYWTGERVALKDDKVVYTTGNYENVTTARLRTNNANNRTERNESYEHAKSAECTCTNIGNKAADSFKYIRISAEKSCIKEKEYTGLKDLEVFEISRHEGSIDTLKKDGNLMLSIPEERVDNYVKRDIQSCDIKRRKLQMVDRDNSTTSQSDIREKKYSTKQQSAPMKQNFMYTYYRSTPPADDILSDDQVS